jgi:replicative DNA helicase
MSGSLADIYRPHSVEAEQALLGALMLNASVYDQIAGLITPAMFHDRMHQRLFEAMGRQVAMGKALSPIGLALVFPPDHEVAPGLSFKVYLARLAGGAASVIDAVDHAKLLRDLWVRRKMITDALETAERASSLPIDFDPMDIVRSAEQRLYDLRDERRDGGVLSIGEAADLAVKQTGAVYQDGLSAGATTGLAALDAMIGVLGPGEVMTILAPSGAGKTALLMQILAHNATLTLDQSAQRPGLMIQMEMQSVAIARRVLSQRSGVSVRAQKSGQVNELEFGRLYDGADALRELPVFIDAREVQTMGSIRATVRTMVQRKGVKLVGIDNLQLLTGSDPRHTQFDVIREAGPLAKQLAKDCGVAIIMLAQMTRGAQREAKNWRFDDQALFGGDAMKQASDVMLGLALPSDWLKKHEPDEDREKEHDAWLRRKLDWDGRAEVGMLKARDGANGEWRALAFDGVNTRFSDL